MKVKIKKLVPEAITPFYAKDGDAAMDLTAVSYQDHKLFGEYDKITDGITIFREYKTGLAVEIPKGFFGLIRPRSSVSNYDLQFSSSGIVDSGYRGELKVRFKILNDGQITYGKGDRVAQFMILPYPPIEFEEVDTLSETERGEGGHGSSGK